MFKLNIRVYFFGFLEIEKIMNKKGIENRGILLSLLVLKLFKQ